MKVRFSARAGAHLLGIQEYIREQNITAARAVGARIRGAVEVLRFFPHAGRVGRSEGTYEWVVRGLPYVIVYSVHVAEEEILVLGVFHCAQKR